MKIYGIKMDKNEKGKKTALIEMDIEEINNLMDIASRAQLHAINVGHIHSAESAAKTFSTLYAIKYNKIWKE